MIGGPFVGQLVEAIILDIPSLVPQMDDAIELAISHHKNQHTS